MNSREPLTDEQLRMILSRGEPLEDIKGPNVDCFVEMFRGVENLNFFWGDKSSTMTADERALEIIKFREEANKIDTLPVEERMRLQIKQSYEQLLRVLKLTQVSFEDIQKPLTDEGRKLSEIFGIVDITLLTLGNWISVEEKEEIREKLKQSVEF